MINLDKLTKNVCSIAHEAGAFIKSEMHKITRSNVEMKSSHDFVTYADKTSEAFLINELRKLFPEAGVLAEESHQNRTEKQYNWIIDPLDGTTNYIHGLAPYSVSIALMEHDREILGVVYEVSLGECFYAHINSKAFLINKIIWVSDTALLSESFIATGFPSKDYSKMKEYMKLLEAIMFESHGIRRLGSAAADIVYVACGRFDIFYEYNLNPWDVAAGSIILQQAGGRVCDFRGNNNYLFGKEIIASNNQVDKKLLSLINKYFYGN
jgi:myo-inositol-1(or 4)-monophosphatase